VKRPSSLKHAIHQQTLLVGRRLTGSNTQRKQHRFRMLAFIKKVYCERQRGPYQITWNDCRHALDQCCHQRGVNGATELFTSLYLFACLRGKQDQWLPFLYGPWCARPKKGSLPACLKKQRTPMAASKNK